MSNRIGDNYFVYVNMTANLHDRHSATQLAFQWQLSDKGLLHNLNLLTECSHLWPHFAYGILAVERHIHKKGLKF